VIAPPPIQAGHRDGGARVGVGTGRVAPSGNRRQRLPTVWSVLAQTPHRGVGTDGGKARMRGLSAVLRGMAGASKKAPG